MYHAISRHAPQTVCEGTDSRPAAPRLSARQSVVASASIGPEGTGPLRRPRRRVDKEFPPAPLRAPSNDRAPYGISEADLQLCPKRAGPRAPEPQNDNPIHLR